MNRAIATGVKAVSFVVNAEASTNEVLAVLVVLLRAARAFARSFESWQQEIALPAGAGGQLGPQQSAVKAAPLAHDAPPAARANGELTSMVIRIARAIILRTSVTLFETRAPDK